MGIPEDQDPGTLERPYKNWKTRTQDPIGTQEKLENQDPGY